jgi:hypothetical protein
MQQFFILNSISEEGIQFFTCTAVVMYELRINTHENKPFGRHGKTI